DRLLETGTHDRHVAELPKVYRENRDTLLDALAEEFPGGGGVSWTRSHGGLYVWLSFPRSIPSEPGSRLMNAALRKAVLYVPGQSCYVGEGAVKIPNWEARLSFGVATREQIRAAVRRLGLAFREVLQEGDGNGTNSARESALEVVRATR